MTIKVDNNEATPPATQLQEPTPQQEAPAPTSPAPSPMVEKLLKEKKNAMERVRELELSMQTITDERLKEKEDWKTLYETTKSKLDETNNFLSVEREEKVTGHKLASLKTELKKMGAQDISMDALLKLADTGKLKYDEEHRVVLGAEDVATSIKNAIPAAFGKASPGVDHSAPGALMEEVNMDSYRGLSLKDKSDPEVLKKLFEKSGVVVRK